MKTFLLSFFQILVSCICFAQEPVEMADHLRASGKIYVVVAVLLTILIGILLLLILIDRKVSNLEKKLKQK